MSEAASKARARRSSPAQLASAMGPSATSATRDSAPGALYSAGPALGLGGIQRQVAVNEPGDRHEQEADAAADRVTSGKDVDPTAMSPVTADTLTQSAPAVEPAKPEEKKPEAAVQKAGATPEKKPEENKPVQKADAKAPEKKPEENKPVQKADAKAPEKKPEENKPIQKAEAAKPEEKKPDLPVQKEGGSDGGSSASSAASQAIASKGAGKPLNSGTRDTLESRMGADFGHVRVHDDAAAQASARALNARAFTHGNDIWLGSGASQSDTRLMAHEATHVVQQAGGVHRMVQRTGPAPAAPLKSPAGEIDVANSRMTLPFVEIPKFKADFLGDVNKKNVALRKGGDRDTDQRQIWLTELGADVEAAAEKKITEQPGGVPKPEAAAGKTATDPKDRVYFYRLGDANKNLLIGTPAELKSQFVIPRWDKSGRPRAMDVDHKIEWQLGGEDKTNNMQVLDAKANRSAGSTINSQVRKFMKAAIKPHVGKDPFKTMPTEKELSALKATYTITVGEIKGVDGLDSKNPIADKDANWSATQVKAVEEPFKALKPLTQTEIDAIKGSAEKLVLFPLESGGSPKEIPWKEGLTGPQQGKLADKGFKSFHDATISYDNTARTGNIHGIFKPKKPKTIKEIPIDLPLVGIPDLPYTARMQKGGLLQSMKHAELYALSPIEFQEANLDDTRGIVARGRVMPSLELLKNFPLEIVVEGDDVRMEVTITKDAFKLPGPIQITEGAIVLALGTSGPEVEGTLGLKVERLGEGSIRAKMGSHGLELHGAFFLDKKVFDRADIELHYVDDVLSGKGTIGIPKGKVRGIKSATFTAGFTGPEFFANGTVEPDIPAVESAAMSINYGKDTGLKFSGDLKLKQDTPGIAEGQIHVEASQAPGSDAFKVKGVGSAKPKIPGFNTSLKVSYDDGLFDASITAAYEKGRLKGSVTVGATNRPVADGAPAGAGEPNGKAITVYGGGSVTVLIAPWLQGTVGVTLTPTGSIKLVGTVGIPGVLNVFPEKKLDKNIFSIGIDIPIVGVAVAGQRIGIFANISGGLDLSAGVGPGQLQELQLTVHYDPEKEAETRVQGDAKLHVPAHAGLRLFVRGGIGAGIPVVSAQAGLEVGASLGLEGALDTGVHVDWTPTKGLTLDAEASVYVEPKLKVDLTGFVKVEADLWVTTIELYNKRWQLAAFEYGSNLRFGLTAPIHYDEGTGFDLSLDKIKFQVPEINPKAMLSDIIDRI
jgi:outer membrane biosynthesis protein TonB